MNIRLFLFTLYGLIYSVDNPKSLNMCKMGYVIVLYWNKSNLLKMISQGLCNGLCRLNAFMMIKTMLQCLHKSSCFTKCNVVRKKSWKIKSELKIPFKYFYMFCRIYTVKISYFGCLTFLMSRLIDDFV